MTNENLIISLRILRNHFVTSETQFRNHDIRNLEYVLDKIEKGEWSCEDQKPPLTRADILDTAKKCVCGQREQDYGTPESNFQLIADLWNDYLFPSLHENKAVISATDVAMMMALMKIARIRNGGGTGDSFVDLAGYAACGGEINVNEKLGRYLAQKTCENIEKMIIEGVDQKEEGGMLSNAYKHDMNDNKYCNICEYRDETEDGEHCGKCCHETPDSTVSYWVRRKCCQTCKHFSKMTSEEPCCDCNLARLNSTLSCLWEEKDE